MTARLVLPADAERDALLTARLAGVGASETAVTLGLSPFESPFSLYWRKVGRVIDTGDNDAMRWGRRLESVIADEFADRHPELTVTPSGLYQDVDHPHRLATPDRELFDGDTRVAALECKAAGTFDGWGEDGSDEILVYYRCQVLWQMAVLDLPVAYLACLFRGSIYREYVIERDEVDLGIITRAVDEFWQRVQAGDPPPLDWTRSTLSTLKRLHPTVDDREVDVGADLACRYQAACDAAREADRVKKQTENELRAMLGAARYAVVAGERVASRSVFERTDVDASRLRKEYREAYEACRRTSEVDRLTPARSSTSPTTVKEATAV